MNYKTGSWAAVAALAALVFFASRSRAQGQNADFSGGQWGEFGPGEGGSYTPQTQEWWDGIFQPQQENQKQVINNIWSDFGPGDRTENMGQSSINHDASLKALLYAIRTAEHGAWVNDGLRYFRFYGGSGFSGTLDHPVATGEKTGVKLPDHYCRGAGLSPGCVSTAAGAYQIILPTWRRYRASGRWGPRLNDFSVASQDEAARRILQDIGAIALLNAGNIEGAITRAGSQWASLPGSTSGQPKKSMEWVMAHYQDGLDMAT